jgi:hypothetical protein
MFHYDPKYHGAEQGKEILRQIEWDDRLVNYSEILKRQTLNKIKLRVRIKLLV